MNISVCANLNEFEIIDRGEPMSILWNLAKIQQCLLIKKKESKIK